MLEVVSEPEPEDVGEETSISEMSSKPQSISSSSMGTSKGCHVCIEGPTGMLIGTSIEISDGKGSASSPSADHIDVTSLLPSIAWEMGDESDTDE